MNPSTQQEDSKTLKGLGLSIAAFFGMTIVMIIAANYFF